MHCSARNRQLQSDLEKKDNCSESSLREERQQLENQFKSEKLQLESTHVKETSELAERIAAFEAAENDLRNQNKALLERLDEEKRLFELRFVVAFFSFLYCFDHTHFKCMIFVS